MRQISVPEARLPINMPAKTKLIRMPGIARHLNDLCRENPMTEVVPSG